MERWGHFLLVDLIHASVTHVRRESRHSNLTASKKRPEELVKMGHEFAKIRR